MKKLLSIICTLAIVMGVVLVPGMFSTSAATVNAGTALTPTAMSTNAAQATVAEKTAYGRTGTGYSQMSLTFDFVLEDDAAYVLEYSWNNSGTGSNNEEFQITVADGATGAPVTTANKGTVNSKNLSRGMQAKEGAWSSYSVYFKTAWLNLEDTVTARNLAVFSYSYGNNYFADFKIYKVTETSGESLPDFLYGDSAAPSGAFVMDGEVVFGQPNNDSWQRSNFGFDDEIQLDHYYMLKMKTKTTGGKPKFILGSYSNDFTAGTENKLSIKTPNDANKWYETVVVFKGGDVVTAAQPKLRLQGYHEGAVTLFKGVQIIDLGTTAPFFTAFSGNASILDDTITVEETPVAIKAFGIPENDTYGAGWGSDHWMASNYVLEADASYIVSYKWRGHDYDNPIWIGAASSGSNGFTLNKKVIAPDTSNKTSYKQISTLVNANDIISDTCKNLAFCIKDFGGDPYYIYDVQVEKVTLNADNIYPITVRDYAYASKDGDDVVLNTKGWEGTGAYVFKNELAGDKYYKLTFDFKGANRKADGSFAEDGGDYTSYLWYMTTVDGYNRNPLANTSTRVIIDEIVGVDSQYAWTPITVYFKGSDIGAGATNSEGYVNKYFALGRKEIKMASQFKNIKLVEVAPADYSEVNAAIDEAEALDETLYKNYDAVDSAIQAVVTGKYSDEQAAVDAMAEAINDAIDALEYKDADYTAVNAAVAAANALNPAEYVDFSAVTNAVNAVVPGKNITEQTVVDGWTQAINDAVAALVRAKADYTAVDAAIAAAGALTKEHYVDFSAVDAAIALVVRDKEIADQAIVDGYATAINAAIAALVKKGADYTDVNEAKAAAEALDKDNYVDFSGVDAAIAAVVTGKTIDQQAEVDAMATAINNAIAALELKDADYSEIDELEAYLNTLDPSLYTDVTANAVGEALDAVVPGKKITEQDEVDAWADAIQAAIDALEKKPADYTALNALIAEAEALDAEDYTNYDEVQEILDEITDDKKIDEQDEVDAWADALDAALDALEDRADYSAIAELEAQYPDFDPDDYTEESLEALIAVIEKLEANGNLPATEQDKVDELAKELEAALKALVKKPVQDSSKEETTSKEETASKGDNTTEKTPDKTGDNSNIFVAIVAMVVSVLGLAVLVIAKKRRA